MDNILKNLLEKQIKIQWKEHAKFVEVENLNMLNISSSKINVLIELQDKFNFIESDLKLVTSVAQETSKREQCTKHVNFDEEKECFWLSDIYVEGTTLVSFTNGIKR